MSQFGILIKANINSNDRIIKDSSIINLYAQDKLIESECIESESHRVSQRGLTIVGVGAGRVEFSHKRLRMLWYLQSSGSKVKDS